MSIKRYDIQTIKQEPSIVHSSSILETENHQLLSVWYQGSYETSSDTKIMISRKYPDDNHWTEPEVFIDFNGLPLGNPVLWSRGHTVYITFSVLMEESWKSSMLFYSSSNDGGKRWTAPSLFISRKGFMPKTQPIQNRIGDTLFPLYHESDYCPYIMIIKDMDNILYSPLVAETMARNKAIQPVICGTEDGRLLMFCRSNQGTIWKSFSYNDGYSWSICEPTNLLNPDSAIDLISYEESSLLLISNPSSNDRSTLQISSSQDSGESWSDVLNVVQGNGEYSYPCMIRDMNGNIHVTYTENRYMIKHIEIPVGDISF